MGVCAVLLLLCVFAVQDVENSDTQKFLYHVIHDDYHSGFTVWIGLRNSGQGGSFVWDNGVEAKFFNWAPTMETNVLRDNGCVAMDTDLGGVWKIFPCHYEMFYDTVLPFVCQIPITSECQVCGNIESNVPCTHLEMTFARYVQCDALSPYCMNDVIETSGSPRVFKRCANETTCMQKWWLTTSQNPDCMAPGSGTADFECHYCCHGNDCNRDLVPDSNTLYQPNSPATATSAHSTGQPHVTRPLRTTAAVTTPTATTATTTPSPTTTTPPPTPPPTTSKPTTVPTTRRMTTATMKPTHKHAPPVTTTPRHRTPVITTPRHGTPVKTTHKPVTAAVTTVAQPEDCRDIYLGDCKRDFDSNCDSPFVVTICPKTCNKCPTTTTTTRTPKSTSPAPTTTPTTPPPPTTALAQNGSQCVTCGDQSSNQPCTPLDLIVVSTSQCPDLKPFCMNDISRTNVNGKPVISRYKRCVDEVDCRTLWFEGTSDRMLCTNFSPNAISNDVTCHLCCYDDRCNMKDVPPQSTWYHP